MLAMYLGLKSLRRLNVEYRNVFIVYSDLGKNVSFFILDR